MQTQVNRMIIEQQDKEKEVLDQSKLSSYYEGVNV